MDKKFTKIKSMGFVNNEWQIILEDDSVLFGVQSIEMAKPVDGVGQAIIKLIIENLK